MSAASPAVAVSSSSTLWATASKEWVIPAKPKPGRKPKKDVAPPVQDEGEVDSKGRRVQNRAAQRAFRERKQSQLAELQARVQQYEQGEIERNVALQNIAKRLKEENEKLRKENALLKERVMQFENERAASKRSREESHPLSPTDASDYPARKRTKSSDPLTSLPPASTMPISYASSPSSMASSPESSDAHSSFSPVPIAPTSRDTGIFGQGFSLSSVFDLASEKINLFEPGGSLDTFDCGFCNENTPCVCRELALQQMTVSNTSSLKLENIERVLAQPQVSPSPAPARPSILDNLPAFQAAVPLRRRAPNPSMQPIFPITLPSPEPPSTSAPSCTGDPANCPACADDAFGKAFCAAISKSVACSSQCTDCPSRLEGGACSGSVNGCCGNPAACGRASSDSLSTIPPPPSSAIPNRSALLMSEQPTTSETIPCDDAWRQIKSHPNVSFADLTLLAEVVARRSKCTGPRVEISPAPGSITPERGISPPTGALAPFSQQMDSQAIILTDPHAQYHERQRARVGGASSPPQLVPQEVLVRCGRQRVREVMADGVRDALRLLDAKFSLP